MTSLESLVERYRKCEDVWAGDMCGDDCERCEYHIRTDVYDMLAQIDTMCERSGDDL